MRFVAEVLGTSDLVCQMCMEVSEVRKRKKIEEAPKPQGLKQTDPTARTGDLRVEMSFLDSDDGEWFAQVQIYEKSLYYADREEWTPWDLWMHHQPLLFSRSHLPQSFVSGISEAGMRRQGCEMLQVIRNFVPRTLPETYVILEGDCP